MDTLIHPTAIIEAGADLDSTVSVGAYAYVGKAVQAGPGTKIMHHATVDGKTTLGKDNEVHPYAYLGGQTHDLKYEGGVQSLEIGDRNVFREYSTAHCATAEGLITRLGDDNLILAYSHIAHECIVGNHLIMSSHSALGGHVSVGDHVNIGWGVGVHQFSGLAIMQWPQRLLPCFRIFRLMLLHKVTQLKVEVSIRLAYKEPDILRILSPQFEGCLSYFSRRDSIAPKP
jgi:acyl-ACP--UDP-N-acetylglucosamine O-acyltransferase